MALRQPATTTTFPYVYHKQVIAAGVIFPVVGTIVVILRFWMRLRHKLGLGPDDWLILPALLCVIGMGACLLVGTEKHVLGYSSGWPQVNPHPKNEGDKYYFRGQTTVMILDEIFLAIMIVGYGFIKLSVIYFYRRIFIISSWSTFDVVTKITTIIVILWTLINLFIHVFSCDTHFLYQWHIWYPSGTGPNCLDFLKQLNALMITDFLTDVLVLVLPFPILWRLQMTKTRKLTITCIFLLGASSLGASLARMVLTTEINTTEINSSSYSDVSDTFLTVTTLLYWSMIEAGLAIIAACLPTLQALLPKNSVQRLFATIPAIRSMASLPLLRSRSPSVQHTSLNRGRGRLFSRGDCIGAEADDAIALRESDATVSSISEPKRVHENPRDYPYDSVV